MKMVAFRSGLTSRSTMKFSPVLRASASRIIFTFASRNSRVTGLVNRERRRG